MTRKGGALGEMELAFPACPLLTLPFCGMTSLSKKSRKGATLWRSRSWKEYRPVLPMARLANCEFPSADGRVVTFKSGHLEERAEQRRGAERGSHVVGQDGVALARMANLTRKLEPYDLNKATPTVHWQRKRAVRCGQVCPKKGVPPAQPRRGCPFASGFARIPVQFGPGGGFVRPPVRHRGAPGQNSRVSGRDRKLTAGRNSGQRTSDACLFPSRFRTGMGLPWEPFSGQRAPGGRAVLPGVCSKDRPSRRRVRVGRPSSS